MCRAFVCFFCSGPCFTVRIMFSRAPFPSPLGLPMEYVFDHVTLNECSIPNGITRADESVFPPGLRDLPPGIRPLRLHWLGESRILGGDHVMVCGARNASEEGCGIARMCGRLLAEARITVASGYARGVDLAAHHGALDAGGDTLAFLPYGIARFRVHRGLGDSFSPERFLAVSELEPWQFFSTQTALRRNTLLAAISSVVIVVEPGESGGTWYSAEKARELGKPLFFLEGNRPEIIDSMECLGATRLEIRSGEPDLGPVFDALTEGGMCV
jgi:predicted Rossmann fold nucleotide-binding protein DprA/Smf involved in DNA uptake